MALHNSACLSISTPILLLVILLLIFLLLIFLLLIIIFLFDHNYNSPQRRKHLTTAGDMYTYYQGYYGWPCGSCCMTVCICPRAVPVMPLCVSVAVPPPAPFGYVCWPTGTPYDCKPTHLERTNLRSPSTTYY